MACYSKLCDGIANLSGKAFNPAHVRGNPNIFTGRAVRGGGGKARGKGTEETPPEEGEEKGYLLIRDLWTQGTDSSHNMRVVNTDTASYQYKTPEKCLENAGHKKNKKQLNTCLNER